MLSRFVSNLLLAILAGTLTAMSLLFAPGVVRWLALGGGCAAFGLIAGAFLARGRGPLQRWLDALGAIVAAWTIVASSSFTGSTLGWLSFSGFAGLAGCALAGLIAHEVVMERAARAWRAAMDSDPREGRDGQGPQLSRRPVDERVITG